MPCKLVVVSYSGPQQPPDPLLGQVLQNSYRIERRIGTGGMGSVYEASHLRLGRRLAIKVLSPEVAGSAEALARFRQEALVTSSLGNPHIVEVFDFNHMQDGTPYLVMELLEGEDVAARICRVGPLALSQVVRIVQQAASALHAAHQKGIVHRDLKPQNIFLCRHPRQDDYVKIVDFGISKVLGSRHAMTGTHELLGSPTYMSPEQAMVKASRVDLRADIFTMGTLTYLMLAGRPPFVADSVPDILFKIVRDDPPSLQALCPGLPPAVEQVIFRALHKDRQQRFDSMEQFSRALRDAASGAPDLLAAARPASVLVEDTIVDGQAGDPAEQTWVEARTDALSASDQARLAGLQTPLPGPDAEISDAALQLAQLPTAMVRRDLEVEAHDTVMVRQASPARVGRFSALQIVLGVVLAFVLGVSAALVVQTWILTR